MELDVLQTNKNVANKSVAIFLPIKDETASRFFVLLVELVTSHVLVLRLPYIDIGLVVKLEKYTRYRFQR